MPNLYNLTLHNETFQVISVPVNPKTAHVPPPLADPRPWGFFEKFWSDSPVCWQLLALQKRQMPHPPVSIQKCSHASIHFIQM